MTPAVITGVGLAVSGLGGPDDLLEQRTGDGGFVPAVRLAGRAMRHKDRASRFALRAAEAALQDAGLLSDTAFDGPSDQTAVVVSSNLGNLDSVCEFADVIGEHGVTMLSPVGLPHTSSNAIAGWVAIQYGLRGPNVTVCNGPTSGLDAMYWARNLIAVGRAQVAVVIGVEPDTAPVARLLADRPRIDGAVAVVVESAAHSRSRSAKQRAVIADYARTGDLQAAVSAVGTAGSRPVRLWLVGGPTAVPADCAGTDGAPRVDLTARLGDCSGALGVLQCAAAVSFLGSSPDHDGVDGVLATAGGAAGDDAAAALLLTGVGGTR